MKPGKLEDRMAEDGWITTGLAAEIAGRDLSTIRRWVEDGTLRKSRRVRDRIFVSRAEVEALVNPAVELSS